MSFYFFIFISVRNRNVRVITYAKVYYLRGLLKSMSNSTSDVCFRKHDYIQLVQLA